MVDLSRQLMNVLSKTVRTWDEFRQKNMAVFLYDADMSRNNSPLLDLPLGVIENAFSELRLLREELQDLNKELSEDYRQAVSPLFPTANFIGLPGHKDDKHFK